MGDEGRRAGVRTIGDADLDWTERGHAEQDLNKFAFGVMLAPTVGAILACVFGPGLVRFGMPSWRQLARFLPAVLVFLITLVAALVSDAVTFQRDQVAALLLMASPRSVRRLGGGDSFGR